MKPTCYSLSDKCNKWITKCQLNESMNSPHQLPHLRQSRRERKGAKCLLNVQGLVVNIFNTHDTDSLMYRDLL